MVGKGQRTNWRASQGGEPSVSRGELAGREALPQLVPGGLRGDGAARRIVIIFSRLGTGAGAEGTLADFCRVVLDSGASLHVVVGKSSSIQRKRFRRKLVAATLSDRPQVIVLSGSRVLDFRVSRSVHIHDVLVSGLPLTALRFLLDFRRIRVARALRAAEKILVGHVLSPRGALELKRLAKRAEIILNHNGEPADFRRGHDAQMARLQPSHRVSYEAYLEHFSYILFQNEGQRKTFSSFFGSFQGRTVTVWPSCDEPAALAGRRSSNPYEPQMVNLLCLAKFQPGKGQLELISAFRSLSTQFPSARLHLAGGSVRDRSYLQSCQRLVASEGLEGRVVFLGYRPDAMRFLAHADIFVLASKGEGTSRAMREASFLGIPIVASRLDGGLSFLGEAGAFWVRDGDNQLRVAMELAIGDPLLRWKIAQRARARYHYLARWGVFVTSTRELFCLEEHKV